GQDRGQRDKAERDQAREREQANPAFKRGQTPDPTSPAEAAPSTEEGWLPVADPICTFFGPNHDKFVEALQDKFVLSNTTEEVAGLMPPSEDVRAAFAAVVSMPSAPGGSRTDTIQNQG